MLRERLNEIRFSCFVLVCTLVASACDDTDIGLDGGNSVDALVHDASTMDAAAPFDAGITADAGIVMDAGGEVDAGAETDAGPCVWESWGNATYVFATATEAHETGGNLSPDGLELFFTRNVAGWRNQLYVATRDSTSEPFSTVKPLDYINTANNEAEPQITPDGRTLYFHAQRPGGYTTYVTDRANRSAPFLDMRCALVDCAVMLAPTIGRDSLTIYGHVVIDATTSVLVEAHRASPDVEFDAPTEFNAADVNAMNTVAAYPGVSPDGLEMYYSREWSGTLGCSDIWVATRDDVSESFGDPHVVQELSTTSCDENPSISSNGRFLVLSRGTGAGYDLWIYERTCQ